MSGTFAITTHVSTYRIADWLLAHGYESRIAADVDSIAALLDGEPFTFEHDGLRYTVRYSSALEVYDVAMASATSERI